MQIPYCYHICWQQLGKHYYGVQYNKNANPEDLWVKYFTQQKVVKKYRIKYGDPDIIEVRKTFDSIEKACKWEQKVLKRLNVETNQNWLNKQKSGAMVKNKEFGYWKCKVCGHETTENNKAQHVKYFCNTIKIKCQFCQKEYHASAIKNHEKYCQKNPNKIKIKRIIKNKPEKIFCSYCEKYIDPGNYNQYHGEQCKCNKNRVINYINCEYCQKQVIKEKYHKHLSGCKLNPNLKFETCQFCNKQTTQIINHLKVCKLNPNREIYTCLDCGYEVTGLINIKKHLNSKNHQNYKRK